MFSASIMPLCASVSLLPRKICSCCSPVRVCSQYWNGPVGSCSFGPCCFPFTFPHFGFTRFADDVLQRSPVARKHDGQLRLVQTLDRRQHQRGARREAELLAFVRCERLPGVRLRGDSGLLLRRQPVEDRITVHESPLSIGKGSGLPRERHRTFAIAFSGCSPRPT